jgi:hypothetical protein
MAINGSRVVLGGLVAGLVMNVIGFVVNGLLLGPKMSAEMDAAVPGLSAKMMTGTGIGVEVLSQFAIGTLIVWLYAAMRPRFGPGPHTAIIAAIVPWICGLFFYSGWLLSGLMSGGSYVIASCVALINLIVGGLVGAWLYREEGTPARV